MSLEISAREASLPLISLNHVSFLCSSVSQSVKFYEEVLGFISIKRPSSFDFHGAWLFNYGVGVHLLQCNSVDELPKKKKKNKDELIINPRDNHISFQCSNIHVMKRKLGELGVSYATAAVEEGGVRVDQLFFHDPDGYMIEICNCDKLPVLPLSHCHPRLHNAGKSYVKFPCSEEVEKMVIEDLVADIMHISF